MNILYVFLSEICKNGVMHRYTRVNTAGSENDTCEHGLVAFG